jgi:hypothetical protein
MALKPLSKIDFVSDIFYVGSTYPILDKNNTTNGSLKIYNNEDQFIFNFKLNNDTTIYFINKNENPNTMITLSGYHEKYGVIQRNQPLIISKTMQYETWLKECILVNEAARLKYVSQYPFFINYIGYDNQTIHIIKKVLSLELKLINKCDLSKLTDNEILEYLFEKPYEIINYIPERLLTLNVKSKLIEIDPNVFEKFDIETKNIIMKEYFENHQEDLFFVLQNINTIKELVKMKSELNELVELKSKFDELIEMKPKMESAIRNIRKLKNIAAEFSDDDD